MKNNIFKREIIYKCDLVSTSLIKVVSWENNVWLYSMDIEIAKIENDNEVVLNRATLKKFVSSGKTKVQYNEKKKYLIVRTVPFRQGYFYYFFSIYMYIYILRQGGGKELMSYLFPLFLSLLITVILVYSVYKDFEDIKLGITEKLRQENIKYEEIKNKNVYRTKQN